jgi:hypothetical protein
MSSSNVVALSHADVGVWQPIRFDEEHKDSQTALISSNLPSIERRKPFVVLLTPTKDFSFRE